MEQDETLRLLPYLDPRDRKAFAVQAGLFERKRLIDYDRWRNGVVDEWEAFQKAFPLLWEYALKQDRALRGRRERLSSRIAMMIANSTRNAIINKKGAIEVLDWIEDNDGKLGLTWFCTLTFRPDVLASTSPETRKTYVARFLKATFGAYVANLDYGGKNGREHYHAVGFLSGTALDGLPPKFEALLAEGYKPAFKALGEALAKPWVDKCGFAKLELVKAKDSSRARLAKYQTKLTAHALKETGKAPRLIYSRKPRW